MSMKTTKTRAAAALDAILALINSTTAGAVKIYTGSAPADLATGATGTLLANCALVDGTHDAFAATNTTTLVATGYTSSSKFAEDASADASGTAGYFRFFDHSGTAVAQGSVGGTGSGADLELSSTAITSGVDVVISSFNVTISGIT